MKRKWIQVVSVLVSVGCVVAVLLQIVAYLRKVAIIAEAQDTQSVIGDITDSEEYAVYRVVIESRSVVTSTELAVIEGQTGLGLHRLEGRYRPLGFEVSDQLWEDFLTKNRSSSTLGNLFSLNVPCYLVAPEDVADLNWRLFAAKIGSTPFLELSRVGFNPEKDEALVHLGVTFLSRSRRPIAFAFGEYILLRKVNGVWVIADQQDTYIT